MMFFTFNFNLIYFLIFIFFETRDDGCLDASCWRELTTI